MKQEVSTNILAIVFIVIVLLTDIDDWWAILGIIMLRI